MKVRARKITYDFFLAKIVFPQHTGVAIAHPKAGLLSTSSSPVTSVEAQKIL